MGREKAAQDFLASTDQEELLSLSSTRVLHISLVNPFLQCDLSGFYFIAPMIPDSIYGVWTSKAVIIRLRLHTSGRCPPKTWDSGIKLPTFYSAK